MYFIHFTFYRFLNSIVYRFFKFVIYAFQPFGCKVNSINKTIYLSHHTFEFKRNLFETSSSAIVSVTLKFLQDNPYIIYITINNDSMYM